MQLNNRLSDAVFYYGWVSSNQWHERAKFSRAGLPPPRPRYFILRTSLTLLAMASPYCRSYVKARWITDGFVRR